MDPSIRPEVSSIISEFQNIISSIDTFKNNYEDQYYDMFLETKLNFSLAIEKLESLSSQMNFTVEERIVLRPFLITQCKPALSTLKEYSMGRTYYLDGVYDAMAAQMQIGMDDQQLTEAGRNIDNIINNIEETPQQEVVQEQVVNEEPTNTQTDAQDIMLPEHQKKVRVLINDNAA